MKYAFWKKVILAINSWENENSLEGNNKADLIKGGILIFN